MTDFFLVRTASLFTLRTFGAQINWRVISRTALICTALLFVKQIAYSFCRRERKQKYVSQWQMTRSKWKWTSIATVPDLCPTTVKILTHLISRYQLPLSPVFVMQNIHTMQQKVTINIVQSLQLMYSTVFSWQYRSWIHERTISLKFLSIILRVLRFEVSIHTVYITNQFQTPLLLKGGGSCSATASVSYPAFIEEPPQ